MTYKEIVKEIEDCGVSFTDFVLDSERESLTEEEINKLGDLISKYEFIYKGSDIDRDGDAYRTYKFKDYDYYVEYTYYYSSYGGSDYSDSEVYQVEPVQIVKVEYKRVKE